MCGETAPAMNLSMVDYCRFPLLTESLALYFSTAAEGAAVDLWRTSRISRREVEAVQRVKTNRMVILSNVNSPSKRLPRRTEIVKSNWMQM